VGAMGGRYRCQAIPLTTPFIDLPGTSGWHDYCVCAYRKYRNIVRPEKSQQAFTVLAAATELEIIIAGAVVTRVVVQNGIQ